MTVLAAAQHFYAGMGTEQSHGHVDAHFVWLVARDFELDSSFAARFIFECCQDLLSKIVPRDHLLGNAASQ